MGKSDEFDAEKAREAAGEIACQLRDLGVKTIAIPTPSDAPPEMIQAATEGSLLALYQFNQHKTEGLDDVKELDAITFLVSDEDGISTLEAAVALGSAIARGTMLARDLSNQPGNKLTPTILAEKAQEVADGTGLTCEIFDLAKLKEKGFGTLIAVAQGSQEEPRFITLEFIPDGEKRETVVYVGKGITFDSGGISLKPGKGMEEMKHDMSGAAAVLGAMQVIGSIKPNLHVVGLIAASENMPSGTAIKPGDVVTSYSGKTVEIINTDAEGRLVLADALGYAGRYEPQAVIDLATLTGAVIVALGNFTAGMMGTDQDLMNRLQAAGEKTHERVWQLPLWDDYDEQVKSDTADAKNIGDGTAGTIAGWQLPLWDDYDEQDWGTERAIPQISRRISATEPQENVAHNRLERFSVEEVRRGLPVFWVHLDIAGTAWDMKGSSYVTQNCVGIRCASPGATRSRLGDRNHKRWRLNTSPT